MRVHKKDLMNRSVQCKAGVGGRSRDSLFIIVVKFSVICVFLSISVCPMYVSGSIAFF